MKFIYIIFSMFVSFCSFAKTLDVHYCDTYIDAETCSVNCRNTLLKGEKYNASSAQKLEFQISEKNGSVLVKTYFGTKFSDAHVLKNCQIFDAKNWDCSDEPFWVKNGQWFAYHTQKMINGMYLSGTYTSKEGKNNAKNASCAK